MPGPFTVDPFTQVHQAIWTALLAYPPWVAIVPPGARINAAPVGTLSAKLPAIMPGDAPEVRVIQAGWSWGDENSMGVLIHQHFAVEMNTTYLNIVPLNNLKFLTLIAFLKERSQRINLGLPFVVDWSFQGVGREYPIEKESGLRQWRAASMISVNMSLPYSVIAEL